MWSYSDCLHVMVGESLIMLENAYIMGLYHFEGERERQKEKWKSLPYLWPKTPAKKTLQQKGSYFAQEGGRWVESIGFHMYFDVHDGMGEVWV